MVKIPTYEERIQAQTGQPTSLGPRISAGAFTGAAQAQARLGETIARSGQNIANNMNEFQKQKDKIAYEFAMQEKNLETKRIQKEVDMFVSQEMENFTRENKATTVTQYQAEADQRAKELRTQALGKYQNALTPNQLQAVDQEFNKTFSLKRAQGSSIAFAKHNQIRKTEFDAWAETKRIEMSTLDPNSEAYKTLSQEIEASYADLAADGISPAVSLKDWKKGVNSDRFFNSIDNASSISEIDALREQMQAEETVTGTEKNRRHEDLDARRAELMNEMVNDLAEELIGLDDEEFTAEKTEAMIASIRREDTISGLVDGEQRSFDLSQLDAPARTALISRIKGRNNAYEAELNSTYQVNLSRSMENMNLAQLRQLEKQLNLGEGRFTDIDDAQRSKANMLISNALADAERKVVQGASNRTADIIAGIEANKGDPARVQSDIDALRTDLINADREDLAENLDRSIAVETTASAAFQSVAFASEAEQVAMEKQLRQGLDTDVGKRTFATYAAKMEAHKKAMAEDFVGYYNKERMPDGQRATVAQLIQIQTNLGVSPMDIRVTSNAELRAFKDEFDNAQNYAEKGDIAERFLAQYGVHGNKVMRHLMTTKTITLSDNLIMAYPNDVTMKGVSIYNDPENVKKYKSEIPKTQRDEVSASVTDLMGDYSTSILGGVADGVLGGGITGGRTNHVMGMRDIVMNTAQGYLLNKQANTPEEAAELAYQHVIGSKFDFVAVNDQQLRLEANRYQYGEQMGEVLQSSLRIGGDTLRQIIDPPPAPIGASEQEIEAFNEEYFSDLSQRGSWRTTTDNKGAYLVDQLGNIVTRKGATGQDAYFTIQFDELSVLGQGYANSSSSGSGTIADRQKAYMQSIMSEIF